MEKSNTPEAPKKPCIYVFLNSSLAMSTGKAAAQAVHAAAAGILITPAAWLNIWQNSPHKTVIILDARDESHLRNVSRYLADRGVESQAVIDEGVNETEPHTYTALATTVIDKADPHVEATMSSFQKYIDRIKVSMEINR